MTTPPRIAKVRDVFLDGVGSVLDEAGLPAARRIAGTQVPVDIRTDPSVGRGRARIEIRTAAPDAEASTERSDGGARVDLRGADLSEVEPHLTRTSELSMELARLVADRNGVPPMLDQGDPFDEVLRALPGPHRDVSLRMLPNGTAGLLEHQAERMLGASGARILLPHTLDGLPQSVAIFLHAGAVLTGVVEEQVDAFYELRYSVGTYAQSRYEAVVNVTVRRGLGLRARPAPAAGRHPASGARQPE